MPQQYTLRYHSFLFVGVATQSSPSPKNLNWLLPVRTGIHPTRVSVSFSSIVMLTNSFTGTGVTACTLDFAQQPFFVNPLRIAWSEYTLIVNRFTFPTFLSNFLLHVSIFPSPAKDRKAVLALTLAVTQVKPSSPPLNVICAKT